MKPYGRKLKGPCACEYCKKTYLSKKRPRQKSKKEIKKQIKEGTPVKDDHS